VAQQRRGDHRGDGIGRNMAMISDDFDDTEPADLTRLLTTTPTTMAGVIALPEYLGQDRFDPVDNPTANTVLSSAFGWNDASVRS
jgi:hypothetical protein